MKKLIYVLLSIVSLTACTAGKTPTASPNIPTIATDLSDGSPPPATLEIDGISQAAGVGTYCWSSQTGTDEMVSACVDKIGIPTAQEPLHSSSPVTARLSLALDEAPKQLTLSAFEVSSAHELPETAGGYRWWRFTEGFTSELSTQTSQEIHLELDPGLYVFYVFAVWEGKGDVSYGFLVEVN